MSDAAERAYRSGRAAFKKGKARSDNPGHCVSSASAVTYWEWFRGFDDAADESLTKQPQGNSQ